MARWARVGAWSVAIATGSGFAFFAACRAVARFARARVEWRQFARTPEEYGLAAVRVDLVSSDGLEVAGWWFGCNPSGEHGRATVVVVHGIGGNRSSMLPHARFLTDAGYDVLAIDLRAHGESHGAYPSPGYLEVAEVRAAVAYARRRSARPVVLLGHSMGAVAVLHAAARAVDVAATVADSAFVSYFDMMARVGAGLSRWWARRAIALASSRRLAGPIAVMVRLGGGQPIDPRPGDLLPVLPRITCPVLFVTGDRDVMAPTANTRRMARTVPRGLVAELPAGHQTHEDAPLEYEQAVLGFLDGVLASDTPQSPGR